MRSDSVKNMSAYADQNHAPSLATAQLEFSQEEFQKCLGILAGRCASCNASHIFLHILAILYCRTGIRYLRYGSVLLYSVTVILSKYVFTEKSSPSVSESSDSSLSSASASKQSFPSSSKVNFIRKITTEEHSPCLIFGHSLQDQVISFHLT